MEYDRDESPEYGCRIDPYYIDLQYISGDMKPQLAWVRCYFPYVGSALETFKNSGFMTGRASWSYVQKKVVAPAPALASSQSRVL